MKILLNDFILTFNIQVTITTLKDGILIVYKGIHYAIKEENDIKTLADALLSKKILIEYQDNDGIIHTETDVINTCEPCNSNWKPEKPPEKL